MYYKDLMKVLKIIRSCSNEEHIYMVLNWLFRIKLYNRIDDETYGEIMEELHEKQLYIEYQSIISDECKMDLINSLCGKDR